MGSPYTYGFDEAMTKLKQLEREMIKPAEVEKATKAGLLIVARHARVIVRSTSIKSGRLAKSIGVRKLTKKKARQNRFVGGTVTGPDHAKAPHAHLVEHGTAMRFRTTKNGQRAATGYMPSRPFMRPAFIANRRAALNKFHEVFGPILQRKIDQKGVA